jgi:hypothetical protein
MVPTTTKYGCGSGRCPASTSGRLDASGATTAGGNGNPVPAQKRSSVESVCREGTMMPRPALTAVRMRLVCRALSPERQYSGCVIGMRSCTKNTGRAPRRRSDDA